MLIINYPARKQSEGRAPLLLGHGKQGARRTSRRTDPAVLRSLAREQPDTSFPVVNLAFPPLPEGRRGRTVRVASEKTVQWFMCVEPLHCWDFGVVRCLVRSSD
ncbi:hypothetical protein MRX96_055287 [Rhipicephalus microplus]